MFLPAFSIGSIDDAPILCRERLITAMSAAGDGLKYLDLSAILQTTVFVEHFTIHIDHAQAIGMQIEMSKQVVDRGIFFKVDLESSGVIVGVKPVTKQPI